MKKLLIYFILFLSFTMLSCNNPSSDTETKTLKSQTDKASMSPEERLKELGINLSEAGNPVANYVNAVRTGNLLFLAGKGPKKENGAYITGKVGADLTEEEGYEAARRSAIAHLSVLKAELGSLDKVKRIVKVRGMVNATPDFTNQPEVINGYSDLMVEVFGEKGKHTRTAVGMGSLPRNIAVEVEVVVEVEEKL